MDTERRKVARRLRGDLEDAKSSGHYCIDSETVRYICDILGLRCSRCPHPWAGLEALADLIEPSCDRDALLKLADDIDKQTDGSMFDIWLEDGHYIARRIREALGE